MTMKKKIGIALFVVLGIATVGGLMEYSAPVLAELLYAIGGIGFFIFGIWAGVLLVKK